MRPAVLILGLDGRVSYGNAAALAEYGYALPELQQRSIDDLVDLAAIAERIGAGWTPDSAGVRETTHIHRRKDGSTFPAALTCAPMTDGRGGLLGHVLTIRNASDGRHREEQLRQSEKLAALGELVAGVAHELNNPLTGISAFAQLLLEDGLDPDQHESVRLIKREADRAVGVIRDLLLFARKSGPTRSPVDVNELIRLTLRLRTYGLRSAGIDVQVELDPELPPVAGDSQRLQQVILNLIVNAEHALQGTDRRRLVVRTDRAREGVAVSVTDNGTGIDEETRQRIFEPFFTTKPPGQGTGLGLSVSYGIVRAHGGTIQIETTPGVGTTFRVTLPRSVVPAAASA